MIHFPVIGEWIIPTRFAGEFIEAGTEQRTCTVTDTFLRGGEGREQRYCNLHLWRPSNQLIIVDVCIVGICCVSLTRKRKRGGM